MECVALDSSSSPPPAQSKDVVSAASSSSSSVDGPLARYICSAAAGSKKIASDSSSASSRSSGSSDISSSRGGDFLSKFVSSEAVTIQPQAPTSAAVSDAAFPRKEQKSSYRTIRYFDEADASITCFNCGGCGHMSRECVQAARPRPCNICGSTDHSVHSCPNTPCFRCRLTGHRAKDCTSRRWAKDMCWRCLRTDSHSPWECNRAQVLSLAPLSHPSGCPNCGKPGHSAFHCPEAPFNELLLRPGADISSVVPIDPWKSSKDKKNKKSPVSGSKGSAVPVLKDPKKITKMLQKLQKAKRSQRKQESTGATPQALQRIQKKIDRLSAMDSAAQKDFKKPRKAGIGKK